MKNGADNLLGAALCRSGGFCLSLFMITALTFTSFFTVRQDKSFIADSSAMLDHSKHTVCNEISTIEPAETVFDNSGKIKKICKEYKKNKSKETKSSQKTSEEINVTSEDDETLSTTSTTSTVVDSTYSEIIESTTETTVTTTVTTQSVTTTAAIQEPDNESNHSDIESDNNVSNGMKPFNYNDVSSIASDLNNLGDFVEKLTPSVISWDMQDYDDSGCIKVTLESEYGIAMLDVKQTGEGLPGEDQTGSVTADNIEGWEWLRENMDSGCNISSVTWLSANFGIPPVRGIDVGSTLAQLTDNYLCINGGATTLYRAADVIDDQNKLNEILAAENLYTFVGGKVYSIGSYLDKYYNRKEHTFRFENCDYIVQYGCNSIMEHNYTTGSWIIEYAIMEDTVIGISFMNKSYYKNDQKTAVSTNIPSSGSESGSFSTTHAESSSSVSGSDSIGEISEEELEIVSSNEEISLEIDTDITDGDLNEFTVDQTDVQENI